MITNTHDNVSVHEIAENIYRISTSVALQQTGGFTFNQYLLLDDEPLLFHTGPRKIFPLVYEAVANILAVEKLRHIAFSHVEGDECGSLNEWLAVAPHARPLCGKIAAMTSVSDMADRAPQVLAHGQCLILGNRTVEWFDAPHLPHGWDCGYLMEKTTSTLFCGDLFTQDGANRPPLTESDIFEASESMRRGMDYFAHAPNSRQLLAQLAAANPTTLACMHGSAWRGNGAELLMALADAIATSEQT